MKKPTKNRAAQALGRLGGSANTRAQNRARKVNAQRAGRPGRVCIDCGQPVHGGHKDADLDVSCGGQGWRWRKPTETAAPSLSSSTVALNAIARELSGKTWDADTVDRIAAIVRDTGRHIREVQ